MSEGIYWIWLSLCFPVGSGKMGQLLAETDAAAFWALREDVRKSFPYLDAKDQEKVKTVSLERAEQVRIDCEEMGISFLTYADDQYPDCLRHIYGPPPVLYYKGVVPDFEESLTIGVVGTRSASAYYESVTGNLSYQLAKAGAIIVSGCAVGIDSFGHRGAVKAKKPTVAILGCGVDVNYPSENHQLKEDILATGGLLLSELPPKTRTVGSYFPVRNRLIAALSDGVLVTQAPIRSGSLITAEHAIEQGKDLFCTPPADLYDAQCMGVAELIRDGAKVVFSVSDILESYASIYPTLAEAQRERQGNLMLKNAPNQPHIRKPADPKKEKPAVSAEAPQKVHSTPAPEELTPEQQAVYDQLKDEPLHVDELVQLTGFKTYQILSILTELELLGWAEGGTGKMYQRA